MSAIEIDCIQFTSGSRICEHAVMVEYDGEITILELDGNEIISWNGLELQLDESEWTDEMRDIQDWLEMNEWDFVAAPNLVVAEAISDIAETYRAIKRVVLYTYAPEPDDD